jgi:hypothetical protein
MRSDMFQVIIERPRYNTWWGWRAKGRRGEARRQQEAATWEPVSRGRGSKVLNENLAPLERFLRSRVGQRWDDVRSEMMRVLSVRSAVQKHVLDHVKQMVQENAVLVDGEPYTPDRVWPVRDFYVCPLTGALRTWARPRRRR